MTQRVKILCQCGKPRRQKYYLLTDIMRYRFLSNLFIWAFVVNDVGEMVFRLIVFRETNSNLTSLQR
jgi:hypothetical protein